MAKQDADQELAELRAQLAVLKAERSKARQDITPEPEPGVSSEEASAAGDEDEATFKSQLEQLLELLETEMKENPTTTYVAIFALGVLFGRLLR